MTRVKGAALANLATLNQCAQPHKILEHGPFSSSAFQHSSKRGLLGILASMILSITTVLVLSVDFKSVLVGPANTTPAWMMEIEEAAPMRKMTLVRRKATKGWTKMSSNEMSKRMT